ncbi:hypothetical protein Tco_1511119, partial [Tanacetum coccineum]
DTTSSDTRDADDMDVDDDSEGDDNVDEARQYRVRIRRAKKQTPPIEQHSSPMTSSQDDIYRYLNENPAPTMGDVGLLVDVGMSGLNSHDGSSRNEKPCGDSFDPGLLFEPQTVVLQEDPVTELGAPDQRKTPGAIPTPVESSPGEILAKQACRQTNLVRLPSSTENLTIPEMKAKLLYMMSNDPSSTKEKRDLDPMLYKMSLHVINELQEKERVIQPPRRSTPR